MPLNFRRVCLYDREFLPQSNSSVLAIAFNIATPTHQRSDLMNDPARSVNEERELECVSLGTNATHFRSILHFRRCERSDTATRDRDQTKSDNCQPGLF